MLKLKNIVIRYSHYFINGSKLLRIKLCLGISISDLPALFGNRYYMTVHIYWNNGREKYPFLKISSPNFFSRTHVTYGTFWKRRYLYFGAVFLVFFNPKPSSGVLCMNLILIVVICKLIYLHIFALFASFNINTANPIHTR